MSVFFCYLCHCSEQDQVNFDQRETYFAYCSSSFHLITIFSIFFYIILHNSIDYTKLNLLSKKMKRKLPMRQYQIQVVEYIDAICCITLCHTIVTTKQIRIMQLIPINTFETKYLYSSGERNSNGSITFSLPISQATFYF